MEDLFFDLRMDGECPAGILGEQRLCAAGASSSHMAS
jgi:hypothetical protein